MSRIAYNKYNQRINKACFSCQHCVVVGDEYRCACKNGHLHGQVVNRYHCCELWDMSDGLRQAGSGRGKVKKRDYLMSLANGNLMADVEGSRKLYERMHGSIYENI